MLRHRHHHYEPASSQDVCMLHSRHHHYEPAHRMYEAELLHGRWAMLAAVGCLIPEVRRIGVLYGVA